MFVQHVHFTGSVICDGPPGSERSSRRSANCIIKAAASSEAAASSLYLPKPRVRTALPSTSSNVTVFDFPRHIEFGTNQQVAAVAAEQLPVGVVALAGKFDIQLRPWTDLPSGFPAVAQRPPGPVPTTPVQNSGAKHLPIDFHIDTPVKKQLLQRSSRIRRTHEGLADQEGIDSRSAASAPHPARVWIPLSVTIVRSGEPAGASVPRLPGRS